MRIELFDEIYGFYYSAIFHIIKSVPSEGLEYKSFCRLVKRVSDEYVFPEKKNRASIVKSALLNGTEYQENLDRLELLMDDNRVDEIKLDISWPFFEKEDAYMPLHELESLNGKLKPKFTGIQSYPLTTVEKMWLKSIYSDPRILLFLEDDSVPTGLEDVEALFDWNDYVLFDKYDDGDPFLDSGYREMFRAVLNSVRKQERLEVRFRIQNNNLESFGEDLKQKQDDLMVTTKFIDPDYLEYSERDDKFKLIGTNVKNGKKCIINVATITSCKTVETTSSPCCSCLNEKKEAVFKVKSENNTLERFLLAFSHYEKVMEGTTEDDSYLIKLVYDETDETDVVIRVLSFGPSVRVVESDSLIEMIRDRLKRQLNINK